MELTTQLIMILLPLVVLQLILLIVALRDWLKQPQDMPNRMLWLVVILLVQTLGAVFYFLGAERITSEDTWLEE